MTFREATVVRERDGRFGEKVGAAPSVALSYLASDSGQDSPVKLDMEYDEPARVANLDENDVLVNRLSSHDFEVVATRAEPTDPETAEFLEDFVEHEYRATLDRGTLEFTAKYSLVDHPENHAEELTNDDLRFLVADTGVRAYDSDRASGRFHIKYLDYIDRFKETE